MGKPKQWGYGSFVHLADQFLVSYACSAHAGTTAGLFIVGHAAELYLKAVMVKAKPKVDVSTHGHNVAALLTKVQATQSNLLAGYTLRESAADKWLHNPIMPQVPDPDYDHFQKHVELYWISRYLADTKYLFASHKNITQGFGIAICSLNEYWQPFFFELRRHLGIPNQETGPDLLANAVANPAVPFFARNY